MGSLPKVRRPRLTSIAFLLAIICLTLVGPDIESADAHRKFGFKGGFRGSFGRSFTRGRSFRGRGFSRGFSSRGFNRGFSSRGFNRGFSSRGFGRGFSSRRFGSFRQFGFRGFRGFGRSRFNTLAFRSRRFGSRGFNQFRGLRTVGFRGGRSRFRTFSPGFNSFAFNHFPVSRVHSGFATFQPTTFVSSGISSFPNQFAAVPNSHRSQFPVMSYLVVDGPVWQTDAIWTHEMHLLAT